MAKPQTKAIGEQKPRRLTEKQERYCREYVKSGNQREAYRASYNAKKMSPEAIDTESWKLMQDPRIAQRISGLQEQITDKVVLSREWIIQTLIDNAKDAREQGDFGPSNKALELLGKTDEMGLFIDKSQNLNVNVDLGDILRQRMSAAKTIDAAGS
ncbi:MAG: terminase small subunit [Pseudomonadota bacterium]